MAPLQPITYVENLGTDLYDWEMEAVAGACIRPCCYRIWENLWRWEPSLWDFGGADQKLSEEV